MNNIRVIWLQAINLNIFEYLLIYFQKNIFQFLLKNDFIFLTEIIYFRTNRPKEKLYPRIKWFENMFSTKLFKMRGRGGESVPLIWKTFDNEIEFWKPGLLINSIETIGKLLIINNNFYDNKWHLVKRLMQTIFCSISLMWSKVKEF